MSERRATLLARISEERERQFNLPGSEWDARHGPNDWVAIAAHYLGEEVRRGGTIPDREGFEHALIKAAAIILAALEHADAMQERGVLLARPPH